MKTKFKDVAHLYIGCECKITCNKEPFENGVITGIVKDKVYVEIKTPPTKMQHIDNVKYIKPILKRLTSITNAEKEKCKDLNRYYLYDTREQELGKQADEVKYLLKRGYDLFGLIENNEAVEK